MYRPAAAGHGVREAPRDVEQEDISELVEKAKERCVTGHVDWEERIDRIAEAITTRAKTAGMLTAYPALRKRPVLGYFISALWNYSCPEKIIIYPHDTPFINFIGENLLGEKALIITGNGDSQIGWYAKGPIIIKGPCGVLAGRHATGLLITTTPTDISQDFEGTHVTPEQYAQNNKLRQYIDQLIATATEDPAAAERTFGDGIDITAAIHELVGGGQ